MRLTPQTFFGRNALLLLALFVLGLLCGALTLREWIQKPRITELAELVSRHVQLAQTNLLLVPEQHRNSMRPWLNSRSAVDVLPVSVAGPPASFAPATPAAKQFVEDLRWRLPDAQEIRWEASDRGTVWVRMRLDQEQYWFIERGVFLERAVSAVAIGTLVLSTVLSVSGAALIQRRINRPLARLVEAARAVAAGKPVSALDEGGPEEFAVVSRAFNHMVASLARADAERATLLAGVSHDLRTPMAKLRLAIEMLTGRDDPALVDSMRRSTAEMEAVTEQFLYYARQPSRDEFVEADLSTVVLESIERYAGLARSVGVKLGRSCSLAMHPVSIRRALDNLITNALRYSEGDVDVESDCQDGVARISVLDRGPGIPAAEIHTVKMPFVRGSASVGTTGAGLGLAIVERIVSAHDGRFELLPREGGGLEARIDLPRAEARTC